MTYKSFSYWLTGLSGAGKTTLANAVAQHLRTAGQAVCVLDGDVLRAGLCRDLGFAAADREENMRRTAELAHLVNHQGITVIAALISPTRAGRAAARQTIGAAQFIEVYVNTPLAVCQQRDVKGLYAKARQDSSFALSGLKAPYEPPLAVCQQRDVKGLYAKARQDSSFALSGLKAPYEPPLAADLCIDTSQLSLQDAVARICSFQKPTP